MLLKRRSFLGGLAASLFAAPAIVRASSLMPLRGELLAPSAHVWQSENTLDYEYWVTSAHGGIMKVTGHNLLMAPPGLYQPWLASEDDSGARFRPVNEHKAGLILRNENGELRIQDVGDRLNADPVVTRLREEQDALLKRIRIAKHSTASY